VTDTRTVTGAAPSRGRTRAAGPWLLVTPAGLIVVALALVPLCYGVYLSFTNWSLLESPTPYWQGLDGYAELMGDASFWSALSRTAEWTVGTMAIEVVLGLPIALLLHRRTPVTGFVSGLILLPWVTPFVVLAYSWTYLYSAQFGMFHTLLQAVHLVGPASPLSTTELALPAIVLISGWKGMPFMAVALLATRKSIPDELYEAASIDGAGPFGSFLRITLPLMMRTIGAMSFVLGVLAFYSFDLVWLTTKGGPGDSSTILGVQLYKAFFSSGRPGYAAAMGTFTMVLIILAALMIPITRRLRRAS